jgi:hypothetical protein
MTTLHYEDRENLLAHEIDDLLLRARGLVLVRDILAERGIPSDEIDAYSDELTRVRVQLADLITGRPTAPTLRVPTPRPRATVHSLHRC